jgi:hypothetical protein
VASWEKRLIYSRPEAEQLFLERELIPGSCPACGEETVARYPVATHQGARILTRCQRCFHTLSLERPAPDDAWPPFRSVSYEWTASPAERASRDTYDGRSHE